MYLAQSLECTLHTPTILPRQREIKTLWMKKILVAGYTTSLIMNSILLGQSIVYDKLGKGKRVKDEETKRIKLCVYFCSFNG